MVSYLLYRCRCAHLTGDHPREDLSTGNNLRGDDLTLRGKDPCLAGRDRSGNGVVEEFLKQLPQQLVPIVLPGGACRQGQLRLLPRLSDLLKDAQGIAKQCLAVTVAGKGPVGRKQCLTVGDREAGSQDRPGEAILFLPGEGGEGVSETHREPTLIYS
jgi:hypothetical protein